MCIFGPVPSRRLGQSLGINIIPAKCCSYSCIYCQLGLTQKMQIDSLKIKDIDKIKGELEQKINLLNNNGEGIDYLTFVADGEPTLAEELGFLIDLFKVYGIQIAVISNSSLLWQDKVRSDLMKADWISLKCDSFAEKTWRMIDRPHRRLNLDQIKEGMQQFAYDFKGILATETMLIKNINDKQNEIEKITEFIMNLSPDISYLSIPIRPPAESYAIPPSPEFLNEAYNLFQNNGLRVEYLIGYEGNQFSATGDIEKDVLSITAVHPLKEEAVQELLKRNMADWIDIKKMIAEKKIFEVEFENSRYYLRKF